MKSLILALTLALATLLAPACATFHNQDGSLNVIQILVDARWGLQEACSVQWVPPDACTLGLDAITTAEGIAAKNLPNTAAAVKQFLVDVDARLPAASRLHPYLQAIIGLLGTA